MLYSGASMLHMLIRCLTALCRCNRAGAPLTPLPSTAGGAGVAGGEEAGRVAGSGCAWRAAASKNAPSSKSKSACPRATSSLCRVAEPRGSVRARTSASMSSALMCSTSSFDNMRRTRAGCVWAVRRDGALGCWAVPW